MKGYQIKQGHVRGRALVALIKDGVLHDLVVDNDAPGPETIYNAKASRPVKGQGGMFFDTPDGSAFLRGAKGCLLYTSPSPRDGLLSRMPSSA